MTNVRCPVIKICHVSVTNLNFGYLLKRNNRKRSDPNDMHFRNFPERFYAYLLGEARCTSKIDNDLSKNP